MSQRHQIVIEFDDDNTVTASFQNMQGVSRYRVLEILATFAAGTVQSLEEEAELNHGSDIFLMLYHNAYEEEEGDDE
jgi:hypothetical protein